MSIEEELQENAEHANNSFDKKVAASMAIIAAALAVVSVLGHFFTTEELMAQQRASDQWSYILTAVKSPEAAQKYKANVEKYEKDSKEITEKATEFEHERDLQHHRALRLDLGEVFLEIAIVMASLAILSKRSFLWWIALFSGTAGAAIALTAALLQ
jgi:1-aminocyclopropane-1-carboxylate deaminase/D-cysteine desulfhydrase-like pyridoxal-dependent ACC family enzyme